MDERKLAALPARRGAWVSSCALGLLAGLLCVGCADEVIRGSGSGGVTDAEGAEPDLGTGPDVWQGSPDQGQPPERDASRPGDGGHDDDVSAQPDAGEVTDIVQERDLPAADDAGRPTPDQGTLKEDSGPDEPEGPCGSWEHPCEIEALPAQLRGDTAASEVRQADRYAPCAPGTAEDGPEVVYTLVAPADGLLRLSLDDEPGDGVDNDVHLLDAPSPDACVARDNVAVAWRVDAGSRYWVSVDAWFDGGRALAGPYVLAVSFTELDPGGCPEHMALVGAVCMDRYEAPNRPGALPLVMYTYLEGQRWCQERGKRLCYDDEWTQACQGAAGGLYPYGPAHQPGVCHDEELWRQYDQQRLNGWPGQASAPGVDSLEALLDGARAVSAAARTAADHVEGLYQGSGGGAYAGCVNEHGVFDLTGNVEEWTMRRDGGQPSFHGKLKGRYWAETRTCTQGVTSHGDSFRFYEIGFRCCLDL